MGEKSVYLNKSQIETLVNKINKLKLREYDSNISVIDPCDRGGYLAKLRYKDK